MNYQEGKIYTIRSHQTDKFYIGSTTTKLHKRFYKHKNNFNEWKKDNNKKYMTSYEILKFDDAYIELLELCNCSSKIELTKKEGILTRMYKNDLVNIRVEGRGNKEYYNDNKKEINEKRKKAYARKKQIQTL